MRTLLLGDLSPMPSTSLLFQSKDIETLFSDTVSLFHGNDINFVNLECAITDCEKSIKKFGPPLKTVPEVADVLKEIGVNYCGLSNNHIFDYGIQGVTDTINALKRVGIAYTGFGSNYADARKNLVVEKNGERVCLIAVCEHEYSYALEDRMGARPYDEYDTLQDIRDAKTENDKVIVIYHGGKEHCSYPSPRLRKACRAMVQSGADVVLCQHSHCIGCYEKFKGGHILYGQGNFHFVNSDNWNVPEGWHSCLAVTYDTKENNMDFVPIVATDKGITLAKGTEKEKILSSFYQRNQELASGAWKQGWHDFCLSMRNNYINVIKNACSDSATETENALFGHYLDCEAHTDVWRELFPTYNQTNEKTLDLEAN